jgi:hypothetical protein
VFQVIDKIDDNYKAILIGQLFNRLYSDAIKGDLFFELASIVNNIYVKDLKFFFDRYGKGWISNHAEVKASLPTESVILKRLSNSGLVLENVTVESKFGESDANVKYKISYLGKQLLENTILDQII